MKTADLDHGADPAARAEEKAPVTVEEVETDKIAGRRAWNEDGPGRNASAQS